jgi:hypothetical protein
MLLRIVDSGVPDCTVSRLKRHLHIAHVYKPFS